MTSLTLLHLLLTLHIAGFTTMAGTVIADFSVNRRLNKYLTSDKLKALSILEGTARFPALIGVGVALLISTGIGMVIVYKGAVAGMLWFRIKMILVLLALIIGERLMGIAGIILAPVILSFVKVEMQKIPVLDSPTPKPPVTRREFAGV